MNPTIKTFVLFAGLTSLLTVFGYVIGGRSGFIFFLLLSLILNFGSYWFSDKIALSMSGAQPLDREKAPQLYALVEQLAAKFNITTPRLYISTEAQANAFATGRNPRNGVVCVTQGLLQNLSPDEVAGVIAHELSHIRNGDVLISTIAAVMAGTISSIANIAMWTGIQSDEEGNTNPVVAILMLILTPIAASLIQLAISRAREYEADANAAKVMGSGKPLANALIKIESIAQIAPISSNPALASLYISNPLSGRSMLQLFSTHPSTESRVQRLMQY